jgi:hypothetical protein
MDERQQITEALREEAQGLFTAILAAKGRVDRLLALGVTALGVAAAAGIANDFPEILLGIPFGLSLLFTYGLQVYGDIIAWETARRRVERSLAELLGESALIAQVVAPARTDFKLNPSLVLSALLYFFLVGLAFVGARPVADRSGGSVDEVFYVASIAGGITVLAATREMLLTERRAENLLESWREDGRARPRRSAERFGLLALVLFACGRRGSTKSDRP